MREQCLKGAAGGNDVTRERRERKLFSCLFEIKYKCTSVIMVIESMVCKLVISSLFVCFCLFVVLLCFVLFCLVLFCVCLFFVLFCFVFTFSEGHGKKIFCHGTNCTVLSR